MIDEKTDIEAAIESIGNSVVRAAHEIGVRAHLHPWHPISTAPCNQNLELEIVSNGGLLTVPFPCRQLNDGEWINADLGLRVRIVPVRWRNWSYRAPIVDHSAQVRGNEHFALVHTHGPIARSSLDQDT